MPALLLPTSAGEAVAHATGTVWLQTMAAVVGISLLSLIGAVTFVVKRERLEQVLPYLVSVSVGALLGTSFLHLLPDLAEDGFGVREGMLVLGGLLLFFVFERFIHHHQHGHTQGHARVAPYAWLNLTGDALHNFTDGLIVASAFLNGPEVGLAATIAVALHEVPQELGDFSILLHGRLPHGKALLLNLATAGLAILGAAVALLLAGRVGGFQDVVLGLTAGGFIYVSAADLIPELHRELRPVASVLQLGCLLLGAWLMLLV